MLTENTSRDSYLLLWWRHCTCAEVCLPSRCLEADCITTCCIVACWTERVLRALPGNGITCQIYVCVCYLKSPNFDKSYNLRVESRLYQIGPIKDRERNYSYFEEVSKLVLVNAGICHKQVVIVKVRNFDLSWVCMSRRVQGASKLGSCLQCTCQCSSVRCNVCCSLRFVVLTVKLKY
jgi:hypothetical protein